ncbi:MAG: protein-tyrosine-phosphatase [Rickettsiales bacterium]|jgi:protein-tyrosine-phosphatase
MKALLRSFGFGKKGPRKSLVPGSGKNQGSDSLGATNNGAVETDTNPRHLEGRPSESPAKDSSNKSSKARKTIIESEEDKILKMVFFCTGNVHRSVMVMLIAQQIFGENYEFDSAGVSVVDVGDKKFAIEGEKVWSEDLAKDQENTKGMIRNYMESMGFEYRHHEIRGVDEDLLDGNDLALCLKEDHCEELREKFPNQKNKIGLYSEEVKTMPDPFDFDGFDIPGKSTRHCEENFKKAYQSVILLIVSSTIDLVEKHVKDADKISECHERIFNNQFLRGDGLEEIKLWNEGRESEKSVSEAINKISSFVKKKSD